MINCAACGRPVRRAASEVPFSYCRDCQAAQDKSKI
jgi:hypothetical protein